MSRFFKNLNSLKNFGYKIIKPRPFVGVTLCLLFTLVALVYLTSKRINNYNSGSQQPKISVPHVSDLHKVKQIQSLYEYAESVKSTDKISTTKERKDSTLDPAIVAFQQWVEDFSQLSCFDGDKNDETPSCVDHDPRHLRNIIKVGEDLASKRREVFSQIIRSDPDMAIQLAIPTKIRSTLPPAIAKNVEQFEEITFDLSVPLYNEIPNDRLIREFTLTDDRKLFVKANSSGETNIPKNGARVFGISLGADFAISNELAPDHYTPKNFDFNEHQSDSQLVVLSSENKQALPEQNKILSSPRARRSYHVEKSSTIPTVKRKILVVPARWKDETVYYDSILGGSNQILTNEFGEEILSEIQSNPYEPVTRETVDETMDQISDFYRRNTDGLFEIVPTVSPVVTYNMDRSTSVFGWGALDGSSTDGNSTDGNSTDGNSTDGNLSGSISSYDSDGIYTGAAVWLWGGPLVDPDPSKYSFHRDAINKAALEGEAWDTGSYAFSGITSISINGGNINTNFTEPPVVSLVGGSVTNASGYPHERFKPASAEVELDENGDVVKVWITDPGAYYATAPSIFLNGNDHSSDFTIVVDSLLVSDIALSNFALLGAVEGLIGAPGVYAITSGGELDPSGIAKGIGFNMSLLSANQYISKSELVLSDDAFILAKANPYTVMGKGDITSGGDLFITEKFNLFRFFMSLGYYAGGYSLGNSIGTDIVDLDSNTTIKNSPLNENGQAPNTFRIYLSNSDSPPRFLKDSNFSISLPDEEYKYLHKLAQVNPSIHPFNVNFVGTGEGAVASLELNSTPGPCTLKISDGGRGYVEEPAVKIVDENGSTVLSLNPSWIRVNKGSSYEEQASLVSYDQNDRWIRGIRVPSTSSLRPVSPTEDVPTSGLPLSDYYLSYRTDIAEEGLIMEVTNNHTINGNGVQLESFLLDATPNTPSNFEDARLLIGSTYSDYDADIHITPIGKGGNDPMPYIECVINMDTIKGGEAQSPSIAVEISNSTPSPSEPITISAMIQDGNISQYAYSWYLNEEALVDEIYLNQPVINYQFAGIGRYVFRVVVSDMKGGVASRNVVITVQGTETTSDSMVSGTVRSAQGLLQGARVVLQKAPVIEHNISLTGSLYDSHFLDGMNNPASFMIDGEVSPQMIFRKGEIHRFIFDKSLDWIGMSFLDRPENTPPRININMLSNPSADLEKGTGYFRNPQISYNFSSAYSSYRTDQIASYYEMLQFLQEQNGSNVDLDDVNGSNLVLLDYLNSENFTKFDGSSFLVTRPYARALMQETNISSGSVSPSIFGETGYITYGGKGYSLANIPTVEVRRSSIWDDYNKSEANATAFVDGVNTISPVIAEEFLGDSWETRPEDTIIPSLIVWGTGGGDEDDAYSEVNASVNAWTTKDGSTMRTIHILSQGKGFEPNSTMAVLHYPIEPHAYWTFDRHESQFEDRSEARYQPSPAWNREIDETNLLYYWTFDDHNSGTLDQQSQKVLSGSSRDENNYTSWGLLGKALTLNNGEVNATTFLETEDQNFTFSCWVRLQNQDDDCNITFIDRDDDSISIDIDFNKTHSVLNSTPVPHRESNFSNWKHIAITYTDQNTSLFVNGEKQNVGTTQLTFPSFRLSTTETLLLDELKIFKTVLQESSIRYLAGISFLDISGGKYHATPRGDGNSSFLTKPGVNMSGDDVPTETPFLNSTYGSGRLGDTFSLEDNGKSLSLNKSLKQYLDLKHHMEEFGLAQGTISVWLKPNKQDRSPIFSLGIDYDTIDNNGTAELSGTGSIFSLEITSTGHPIFAGYQTTNEDKIKFQEWNHLVATFPFVQFWINGEEVPAQIINSTNSQFEEAIDLLELSRSAKFFRIGYSFDRFALSQSEDLPSNSPVAYYDGFLDDLAVYDRILSTDEVNYLYDLRMGREQIPRLEAIVDAVGTVKINDGGGGYRENPDLVFWYGDEENKTDLENNYILFADLEKNKTEDNTTHGTFAYVGGVDDSVYSFHFGNEKDRNYTWRLGQANGWRKLISATGLGEYENASLGDVVWAKRLDKLINVPMPDGRMREQRLVDYVTLDINKSFALEKNSTAPWHHKFFKPNGLYGFVEKINLTVDSPSIYNPKEQIVTAEAFVHFYIDQDANESISIVDPGIGISHIPEDNIKISGKGYQPTTSNGINQALYGQLENDYEGFADIDTNLSEKIFSPNIIIPWEYDWNGSEDVNVSTIDYNFTYHSIAVENPGFGYAVPVSFKVIGGRPSRDTGNLFVTAPLPEFNASAVYDFEEAEFAVTAINADGSLESITPTKMGRGYIDYSTLDQDGTDALTKLLDERGFDIADYPLISVTGGGGHGALFRAIVDSNGSIIRAEKIDGGTGYENIISDNIPTAVHTPSLSADEKNASMAVMLGGYIKKIPSCTQCERGRLPPDHPDAKEDAHVSAESLNPGTPFSHLEPWIEIWDRGRNEADIDEKGLRAHAAPKVVNGKIVKVIVTNSGAGYIDPVAIVRDASPKHVDYLSEGGFRRKWKCTFERTLPSGEKMQCGHVHWSLYPPENCPGETDELLPYEDENGYPIIATGEQILAWQERFFGKMPENKFNVEDANSTFHLNALFLSRKCWGTKVNFVLHDDAIYRNPTNAWKHLDANLTVISKNGKIREIIVDNTGSNYYATEIHVEGTGGGVDAIPVFDEFGLNQEVIFNDPRIKNVELDLVDRPIGAGQGFRERPWAGDEFRTFASNVADLNTSGSDEPPENVPPPEDNTPLEINDPIFGDDDRVDVIPILSDYNGTWKFGQPIMADYLGDRILQVEILDSGIYNHLTDLETISIEYNSSGVLDKNGDGVDDFIAAKVKGFKTQKVTNFVLDDNASYDDNSSSAVIERGLFTETPRVQITDGRNLLGGALGDLQYQNEIGITFIPNNDQISYDEDPRKSYIDLYIDDQYPDQMYYGEGITSNSSPVLPAFGGRILITDGVPGGNWGVEEAAEKPIYSYTDENGYYAFTNLSHGLYNVAVFMEDQKFQESSFRPVSNNTLISQHLYVAGFPDLVLESDNYGKGQSTLLWSRESRLLTQDYDFANPLDSQWGSGKILEGIGRGFLPYLGTDPPELTIIPHEENYVLTPPEIDVVVLADGSLRLSIINSPASSIYFPGDKFTVRYSSTVTGIDFMESYLYSESNQTFNSGVLSSWEYNSSSTGIGRYQSSPKLVISPNDSGGTNILEAILSTDATGSFPNTFLAQVFDANGTELNASTVEWSVLLDFNSSEGKNSNIVQLENALGDRDLNVTGDQIELYLFSTLRKLSGSIHDIEVVYGGAGYEKGEILFINDSNSYGFEASIDQIITETFRVSGGNQSAAPYYEFNDSKGSTPDFSGSSKLLPGHTYRFIADDINASHPFMIGEVVHDMTSSLVTGGPLTGTGGEIILTIPDQFVGDLYYFCTHHADMNQSFDIVSQTFRVSGGNQSAAPYYEFNDSKGSTPDFSGPSKLLPGQTYRFIADDINTSHPFMIGEAVHDMTSSLVTGGPLTGIGGEIILTIPDQFAGDLYYFCTNHSDMNQSFSLDAATEGEIVDINVLSRGFGSTDPRDIGVLDSNGSGAIFEPTLPRGYLILEANFTMPGTGQVLTEQVKIQPSDRHTFSSQEKWLDLYLDSFIDRNSTWWEENFNPSNQFQDLDNDNLTNFSEWRFGTNPINADTDLDKLNDSDEANFNSSPIQKDTDNDKLTDYEEWSWSTNPSEIPDPRNPDSDGDGLLDGEDKYPKNSDGVGILSGRIDILKKYSDVQAKPYYRFAEKNATGGWDASKGWLSEESDDWKGKPRYFYQNGLFYGRDYTIQVYLEINNINSPSYDPGEPFIDYNITLNSDSVGINLLPVDRSPTILIGSKFQNLEVSIDGSSQTGVYVWDINVTDPYYSGPWTMDSNHSNRRIELEGNFTPYLLGLPVSGYDYNSTMNIDLDLVPPGKYALYYTAYDSFENRSNTVEQNITIADKQPPFLTIIDFVSNTGITTENQSTFSVIYPDYNSTDFTYLSQSNASVDLNWTMGIPFNLDDLYIEARDNKSGTSTWNVTSGGTSFTSIDTNSPQIYELNFTTQDDAGNIANLILNLHVLDNHDPVVTITGQSLGENISLEAYRGRGFILEDEVQIVADDSYQNYSSSILSFEANASKFNAVDWGKLTVSVLEGKTLVMPGEDENYTVTFSFTDESNNTGSADLFVIAKDPAWTIDGKAIDGYLKGSAVRFISNETGPSATTDEFGDFKLYFTDEELVKFDFNGDGTIGADEGTMIVTGGIDIDTNTSFLGEIRADAESKIVSPLTSILAFMGNQGFRRDVAEGRLKEAFGLSNNVNLHNFDPYEQIDKNNPEASAVLLANIRLANAINIPEAILLVEGGDTFQSGDLSRALFSQIAQAIGIGSGVVDFQAIIEESLPVACESLALSFPLSSNEVNAISGIIEKSDPSSLQLSGLSQAETKEILIGSQIWVTENILEEVEGKFSLDIVILEDITSHISSSEVNDLVSQRRSNLFSPAGTDFKAFFTSSMVDKDCIWQLETSDGDGDAVYHSLLSGNYDFDGDGINALKLKSDGRLCVEDYDDIRHLAGNTLSLEIKLDDLRGGSSMLKGQVAINNLLALDSSQIESSWYQSDWLGSFYSAEGSWVYHHPIGWLYVHPDGQDGYWFWDHNWNHWWWSKKQAFPWIYRDDSSKWDYLMVMPDGINVFDQQNRRWRRR